MRDIILDVLPIVVSIISLVMSIKKISIETQPTIKCIAIKEDSCIRITCENIGIVKLKDFTLSIKPKNNIVLVHEYQLFQHEYIYPGEINTYDIGYCKEDLSEGVVEYIDISLSYTAKYKKHNENRRIYIATYTSPQNNLYSSLESISYSTNRIANYFDGKNLYQYDRINSAPQETFYEQMNKIINKKKKR